MVSGSVGEISCGVDIEYSYFGTTAFIAIANYRDGVIGHQHLVIPGVAWINVRSEGINSGNWLQAIATDGYGKQATSAKHNQMIAVQLDDSAFVHAGVLHVGD